MTGTIAYTNFPARDRWNDRLAREVQYTGPASYVAGGDPIAGSDILGGGEIYGVYGVLWNGTALLSVWWDYTNQKLVIVDNTGAQASGNLSGYTGTLLFTLKG